MYFEYIKSLFRLLGFNPKKLYYSLKGVPIFLSNLMKYKMSENSEERFKIQLKGMFPVYADRYMEAGSAKGHYFHQDLWAAKKVYENNPIEHVDIGSRVDGFISHLLVFRNVTVIDVRDMKSDVPGLVFERGDIKSLQYEINSIDSMSCLHAIEHIGLGRYGDEIDLDGWVKGLAEMQRVLKPGGKLYLGAPIGKERLYFDAHRVFRPETIVSSLPELDLVSFSYVDDSGSLYESNNLLDAVPNMSYGCGLFEFIKPNSNV